MEDSAAHSGRSRDSALPSRGRDAPDAGRRPRRGAVLVDDEAAVRRVVRAMLEGLDFDVTACAGAAAARRALAAAPPPRLLVTDVVLDAGEDGVALAAAALAADPELRAVICSGRSAALERRRLPAPARVRTLAKPFQPAALRAAIDGLGLGGS